MERGFRQALEIGGELKLNDMIDLLLHFLAGAAITAAILLIFSRVGEDCRRPDLIVVIAVAASLLLGVGKELYDKFIGPGTPEIADITLTWSGGTFALMVIIVGDMITCKRNGTKKKKSDKRRL